MVNRGDQGDGGIGSERAEGGNRGRADINHFVVDGIDDFHANRQLLQSLCQSRIIDEAFPSQRQGDRINLQRSTQLRVGCRHVSGIRIGKRADVDDHHPVVSVAVEIIQKHG